MENAELQPKGPEPNQPVEPDKEEEDCEWLPKSRVIKIDLKHESSPSSSSDGNNVLLRAIETNLNLPAKSSGPLYIHRCISENFCSIFTKPASPPTSPWKGMSSYYPAKLLLKADPQSTDPLVSLLTKLSEYPSFLQSSGVFVVYHALPNNSTRVEFFLGHDRVLGSVLEFNYQNKYLTREEHYVLKLIIENSPGELINEENPDITKERRRADLDFGAFFRVWDDYRKASTDVVPDYKLNQDSINFPLMLYQKDTVRWMMNREADSTIDDSISWMYECYNLPTDSSFFYYPYLGVVTRKQLNQQEQLDFAKSNTLKGGILADEMGLGKTVQMLALISSHRKGIALEVEDVTKWGEDNFMPEQDIPNYSITEQIKIAERSFTELKNAKRSAPLIRYNVDRFILGKTITCPGCEQFCSASVCGWNLTSCKDEDFLCPNCTSKSGVRKSVKTTLIIVPESLIFQWFTEVGKHCSNTFKVLFYFGVKKHGYLQPHDMDKYDVILTTYDTIRAELLFSDVKELRTNLRRELTSLFLVSSLVHVNFWRVIVDESQVIPPGVTAKLPTMFSNIQGKNWWCVTGTPLVKTVADIGALFTFLKLKPFGYPSFFAQRLHSEYLDQFNSLTDSTRTSLPRVALLQLLAQIMGRKTKKSVENQIKLPPLTQTEKKVCFTAVEERQYKDEKERLKAVVQRAVLKERDSIHLADLRCRDRVLQELKTLQETVLTGQTCSSGLGSIFTYSPETVIFRLIHDKKISISSNLREFMANALALAGVQLLMEIPVSAMAIYKHALCKYEEFQTGLGLEELNERESIKKLLESVDQDNILASQDEPSKNDCEDELSGDNKNQEELERIITMSFLLKKANMVFKKYSKNSQDTVDRANIIDSPRNDGQDKKDKEDLPGPPDSKKPRLNEQDTQMEIEDPPNKSYISNNQENSGQVASTSEAAAAAWDELEVERRQKIMMRKLVRNAGEPIVMDATQEAHLMINMHKVQLSMQTEEDQLVSMDRFGKICTGYQKIEKDTLEIVRNGLQGLNKIWNINDKSIIECIGIFFKSLNWNDDKETSALYDYDGGVCVVNETVKKDHLSSLPFIALYDTMKVAPNQKPKKEGVDRIVKHVAKKCLGRCDDHYAVNPYEGQECMKVNDILRKTADHIRLIDHERIYVEEELQSLIDFVMKMTDPTVLLDLFVRKQEQQSDEYKQMHELIDCEHIVIKGTGEDRETVSQYFTELNPCKLCDVWCKLTCLRFQAGLASFHGWPTKKSAVLEFTVYLIGHFTKEKPLMVEFFRTYLRPFFERIDDVTKVLNQTLLIIVELTHRFTELRTAQTLIKDEQLDKIYAEDVQGIRTRSADDYLRKRNRYVVLIDKEVKDLRYLVNLMEQQLTGAKDEFDECPVCKFDLEAFMVFTCGHRICPECFDRIKAIAAADAARPDGIRLSPNKIKCPTCRIINNTKQVMLACRGNTAEESIIPGVVLSAKLSCAVQLMREIMREDSSNKIIVFTTFEPSNATVWYYLIKILKLAKLPFAVAPRNNCGKKILDFEISVDTKILLCSLSMCANGLNMTGANHIIFLDPPHLQSVLNQAIGRINRFGQRREMYVHHLVVEGSLDCELREIAKANRDDDERKGWTIGDIRGMFDIPLSGN